MTKHQTDASQGSPRATSFDYNDLISCAYGELFGPDNARLPLPPMLMFDRITRISADGGQYQKGYVAADLSIKPDQWFFECHFASDPVMPGCLGIDALWQLLGFFLGWMGGQGRGRALGVGEVKFSGQVMPYHHEVRYELNIKRVLRSKLFMGIADGTMAVDGDVIYTARDLKVGLFSQASLQPVKKDKSTS